MVVRGGTYGPTRRETSLHSYINCSPPTRLPIERFVSITAGREKYPTSPRKIYVRRPYNKRSHIDCPIQNCGGKDLKKKFIFIFKRRYFRIIAINLIYTSYGNTNEK